MTKRAAIYIRVSSEKQAEKVSPQIQEENCREYCQAHNYQIVEVYRDTEKYRSGGRMVEPSGTRSDRPHFLRMLRDIDEGRLDIVIAWREDRLYRNVNKAMLEISERVTKNIISVELVKEHYDPTTAIVKAWAAGIELRAKHDRFTMGVTGRLQSGKNWLLYPPFGYQRTEKGDIVIDETEAHWIKLIWKWYGIGVSLGDIRQRLISGAAHQRERNKHAWAIPQIRHVLKNKMYHTGIAVTNWDGNQYEAMIPVIIDDKTAQAVEKRRGNFSHYPAGNLKALTLVGGLIYCKECNTRLNVVIRTYKGKTYKYYHCPSNDRLGHRSESCVNSIHIDQADAEVWRKVWRLIEHPEEFTRALDQRIAEIQSQAEDAGKKVQALEAQLQEVLFERQKVITWARKRIITDEDLEIQISVLDQQEAEIRKGLRESRLLSGNHAEKLIELANLYTAKVRAGIEEVNADLTTEAQQQRQFKFRKRIIDAIVSRVEVNAAKDIHVFTEWNLGELSNNSEQFFCGSTLDRYNAFAYKKVRVQLF